MVELGQFLLASIGGTPPIRLGPVVSDGCGAVWLQLESGNPTGSSKHRMAVSVIGKAVERGHLRSVRGLAVRSRNRPEDESM